MRSTIKTVPFLLLIVSTLVSCKQGVLFQTHSGFTQGTTFSIVYEERPLMNIKRVNRAIDEILVDVDNSLSVYNQLSTISSVNRNEQTVIDSMLADVIRISRDISIMTEGLFDITVGPLVKAWGFGPDALQRFDSLKVDSLLQFVGFGKVRVTDGLIEKDDDRIWLDVNAVAQGYSVDVVGNLLDEVGIRNYLIEIGGEVLAKGTRGDRLWRVGVDRPEDGNIHPGENLEAVIELNNEALATSGNYRKFYVDDRGVKYAHTINPITGMPARTRLLSATIIAMDCATADAFATACMVGGTGKSIEMIRKYDQIEGYLIYSGDKGEYQTWISEGISNRVRED